MPKETPDEFNRGQQEFFDKALIASLQVAPTVAVWPTKDLSEDDRIELITDAAVMIALKLLMKRQVQIDNGEV